MHGHVQETAINVGFACSLLRTDMAQHIVTANTKEVNRPLPSPDLSESFHVTLPATVIDVAGFSKASSGLQTSIWHHHIHSTHLSVADRE